VTEILSHPGSSNATVSEKVYSNRGNPAVLAMVPSTAKRILDIGCGAGDNARILKAKGCEVVGVTYSEVEATLAKDHCSGVHVANLEHGIPIKEQQFDAIICSHVLEHICFPEPLLADAKRLLHRNGLLVAAVPNLLNYKFRLRLILGRFDYEPSGTMDNTHFRWYTFASGKRLFEQNGYDVVQAYADGAAPLWPLRKFCPTQLLRPIDRLACRNWPGLFGGQLVYAVRPKSA
jgi:ubiquinone/menaquinone biosynthesis C-methylase UbiE